MGAEKTEQLYCQWNLNISLSTDSDNVCYIFGIGDDTHSLDEKTIIGLSELSPKRLDMELKRINPQIVNSLEQNNISYQNFYLAFESARRKDLENQFEGSLF
jgi:hypothetical protein